MQGPQAATAGGLFEGGGVGLAHQQAAQFVVHHQQFSDRTAAVVATARRIGAGAIKHDRTLLGKPVEAVFGDQLRRCFEGFAGGRVQAPHQALGEDAVDGRGNQVAFDTHVQQARDTRRRAVGVQGREHQVAGEGRLDGDAAGFQVADFTDHDHVRVLAHDGAQRAGEVEADGRFHLDLVDALKLVFHRVFHGDDLALGGIEPRQRGVQGGGLARAGGPGDEQDTVGPFEHFEEGFQALAIEAQALEIELHGLAVEQTHDHRFAKTGGHRGHPQVQLLALDAQHDAPVLGQAPLGDVQARHDLHPRNHRR